MKVKTQVDFDIFDDEDWNFDERSDVEFFGEDLTDYYTESKPKSVIKFVLVALWWIVSLVGVLFFGIVICLRVANGTPPNSDKVVNMQTDLDTSSQQLERVAGDEVSSGELIQISSLFSAYTHILSTKEGYSQLHDLCYDNSSLATIEEECRVSSEYSLDEYDCTARAYKSIAHNIKLERVNDIVFSNGSYYSYITLSTPSVKQLFEYYLRYSYEIVQFCNVHKVSMTSLSDYINQSMSYSDFPCESQEYVFEVVVNENDDFVLKSDELISSIVDDVYTEAIEHITDIVGSRGSTDRIG